METPDLHVSNIGDIGHIYEDDDGEKTRLRRVGWTAWKYWELGRATGFAIPPKLSPHFRYLLYLALYQDLNWQAAAVVVGALLD